MRFSKHKNKGLEVLVAEDSPTQAERLRYLLEERGYSVTAVADGKQALAAARQCKPALIVSDVMMPEMDGFTLCGEIKRDDQLHDVPVILLTTLADVRDIMKGLECGADNFIRKPYEEHYLLARVDYLLMHQELRKNQKMQMGVEIYLGGQRHFITAERQQIVDLLISVYEEAVHIGEELKTRQRELADSNCTLTGLYHVAEGLNRAISEHEVCKQALEHAVELPGVQAGWIFLLTEGVFRIEAAHNPPSGLFDQDTAETPCECQRRFLAGEMSSVTHTLQCERLDRVDGGADRSCCHVSIPLWSGDRRLGVMNLVRVEQSLFRDDELETLYGVGHQVGIALERARLHEHLELLVEQRTAALTAEVIERKSAEKRFHTLFEYAPDAVVMVDQQGTIMLVNRQAEATFGYARDELLGQPVEKLMQGAFRRAHVELREDFLRHAVPRTMGAGMLNLCGLRKDGTTFPVDISLSPMELEGGTVVAATVRDVTQRKAHEARIVRLNRIYTVLSGINTTIVRVRERQQLFDEVCRIAVDLGKFVFAWIGTLDVDSGMVAPVARAGHDDGYLSLLGMSDAEDALAVGCTLTARALVTQQPVICNDVATDEVMQASRAEALSRGYRSAAVFPLMLDGRVVGVLALYAPEPDVFDAEEMRLLIETAGDISFALDHLEKDDRLNYLAYYDAVTGLPNRTLFVDRVAQKINVARHHNKVLFVIVLDLNRFSSINEALGRQAGDNLLRQFARRLQETLGETDILSHFSADCFGISIDSSAKGTSIVHVMESILSVIRDKPFLIGAQELRVSARAGISSYPGDGDGIDAILHNAESALKKTKVTVDRYLFYKPAFNVMVTEKLSLENKLRRALEEGQLELHYQPKIDLCSRQISGLEALMRWNDPEMGLILPMKFIPLLEETGMILEAGLWALEKAVSDALTWQTKDLAPPRVAVNVSAIQLQQDDFVDVIERVVKGDRDIASRLELEITESLIMRDIAANIHKLRLIREMGVALTIDDFGTGYSSLSYIAKLPVTTLKVDQSFITNMISNSDDLSIVSTIISLAHSLGMRVVAEGVETCEQEKFLRLLKCDEIQGFLFSQAVVAEKVEELLKEGSSLPR
ncbi:EAL domain-containing protein [Rhodanobacter terrae]|uniref:EAL domain-containing protein n=1 Tax=Rhodanobacter terrae TaxID=418647 RepID=A0ABW0SVK5_9GAMM